MGAYDPQKQKDIDQSAKKVILSLKDAKAFTKKHRQTRQIKESPAYFIPTQFLEQFYDIPHLDGIIVVPGIKEKGMNEEEDTELLIVIPATINDGKVVEIAKYYVKINDLKPEEIDINMYTAFGPCPPHPPTPCPSSFVFEI
jgi:hypothetical protein